MLAVLITRSVPTVAPTVAAAESRMFADIDGMTSSKWPRSCNLERFPPSKGGADKEETKISVLAQVIRKQGMKERKI